MLVEKRTVLAWLVRFHLLLAIASVLVSMLAIVADSNSGTIASIVLFGLLVTSIGALEDARLSVDSGIEES